MADKICLYKLNAATDGLSYSYYSGPETASKEII